MMVKAKNKVRDGVRHRPVRVGAVILSLLLAINTQLFGEDASNYVWIVNITAPIIAAFVVERFTFSQAFLLDIVKWIDEYSGRDNNAVSTRIKYQSRNKRVRGDKGVSDLAAILIVFLIMVFLLIVWRRI